MIERWSRDQVLALAPDASSQKAAQRVAAPGGWQSRGLTGEVLFGECEGSGATPYQACVDLSEPAYRCSCPSRKFPCKHALGLLLLWSADGVPQTDELPTWAGEWLAQREARAARSAARAKASSPADDTHSVRGDAGPGGDPVDTARGGAQPGGDPRGVARGGDDSGGVARGAAGPGDELGGGDLGGARRGGAGSVPVARDGRSPRHARVAAGLAELERWLADQMRQGLASATPDDWEGLAKRLIDAQAPGVAGVVTRLAKVREDDDWPARLLAEYALLHLLALAYRSRAGLPAALAETVLMRVGFPVTREEVLGRPMVRDRWDVLGSRDEEQDRLTARRVWLRGRETGRAALILSFAPSGQPLDASLVTGTTIDADLAFYPGAAPLRALVAHRHPRGTLSIDIPPSPSQTPHTSPAEDPSQAHGTMKRPHENTPAQQAPPEIASATPTTLGVTVPSGDARDAGGSPVTPDVAPGESTPSGDGGAPGPPPGVSADEAMGEVAAALAADPWTEAWPLVLTGVVPEEDTLAGFPLLASWRGVWRLLAVSGGRPVTVAAEWTPRGLRPLTTWDDDGTVVIL